MASTTNSNMPEFDICRIHKIFEERRDGEEDKEAAGMLMTFGADWFKRYNILTPQEYALAKRERDGAQQFKEVVLNLPPDKMMKILGAIANGEKLGDRVRFWSCKIAPDIYIVTFYQKDDTSVHVTIEGTETLISLIRTFPGCENWTIEIGLNMEVHLSSSNNTPEGEMFCSICGSAV